MKVAVVIVTWNRLEKLQRCLLETRKLAVDTIVVVDNASTDGTKEWLSALDDSRLHLIFNADNQGGAKGFKCGAEYLCTYGTADWVIFYDDDAWPENDFIQQLKTLSASGYSVFCSRVQTPDKHICKMNIPYKKLPCNFRDNIHYFINDKAFLPDTNIACEVETFSFVGMVIQGDLIKDSYQMIDDSLFIYYDDVYFSWQLFRKGNRIRFSPELNITHDIDISSSPMPAWKVYYLVRNLIFSLKFKGYYKPFGFWGVLIRVFNFLLKNLKVGRRRLLFKYWAHGILDGIKGQAGKYP